MESTQRWLPATTKKKSDTGADNKGVSKPDETVKSYTGWLWYRDYYSVIEEIKSSQQKKRRLVGTRAILNSATRLFVLPFFVTILVIVWWNCIWRLYMRRRVLCELISPSRNLKLDESRGFLENFREWSIIPLKDQRFVYCLVTNC